MLVIPGAYPWDNLCFRRENRNFSRHFARNRDRSLGLAQIHAILTRITRIGEHRFDTRSHKDQEKKPESEIAVMEVPPLIGREVFDAVQSCLKSCDPRMAPARATSGPTLLTGIRFCVNCGDAMTLRTARAARRGTYRYYACSTKARQGKSGCKGRTMSMDKLDGPVADPLESHFASTQAIGDGPRQRHRPPRGTGRASPRAPCRTQAASYRHRSTVRLPYDTIESGMVDKDDEVAKERMARLKALRDQVKADADRTHRA